MKPGLLALVLVFFSHFSFAQVTTTPPPVYDNWKITKVTDGDTVKIEIPGFPIALPLSVRVYGIDTPEKAPWAKCEREANLGLSASAFTRNAIAENYKNGGKVVFSNVKWDKYGGRIVAKVSLDGKDLGAALINAELARPYFGGAKTSWCN